jgi:hypothetical protein
MRYQYHGLCSQYGKTRMILSSIFAPAVANIAIMHDHPIPIICVSSFLCMGLGSIGFILAMEFHKTANNVLVNTHISQEIGHKIIKYGQAALYAIPLCASFGLSVTMNSHLQEQKQSANGHHQLSRSHQ